MVTVERFYFDFDEAAHHITAGADGTDYNITFCPGGGEGVYLQIRMRGREDFRRLIKLISDIGMGLVEAGQPNP